MLREGGKQIGYLERRMAVRLVDELSDYTAFVAGVGRGGGPYLGVSLLMVVHTAEKASARLGRMRATSSAPRATWEPPLATRTAAGEGAASNVENHAPASGIPWGWILVVEALGGAVTIVLAR